jgi:hypothetical protein
MSNSFIKKYLPEIIGSLIGAAGGFFYWKYVGCVSGTCTIKSNWYLMIPWAAVLGFLAGSIAGDIIRKKGKQKNREKN